MQTSYLNGGTCLLISSTLHWRILKYIYYYIHNLSLPWLCTEEKRPWRGQRRGKCRWNPDTLSCWVNCGREHWMGSQPTARSWSHSSLRRVCTKGNVAGFRAFNEAQCKSTISFSFFITISNFNTHNMLPHSFRYLGGLQPYHYVQSTLNHLTETAADRCISNY